MVLESAHLGNEESAILDSIDRFLERDVKPYAHDFEAREICLKGFDASTGNVEATLSRAAFWLLSSSSGSDSIERGRVGGSIKFADRKDMCGVSMSMAWARSLS